MEIQPHKIEHMIPVKPYLVLAEDDEDDVAFFQEAFSSRYPHIGIIHFDNSRELLDYLKSCPPNSLPDFLLLDHLMPAMPAIDVLNVLEKEPKFEKIVKAVWSTLMPAVERDRCLDLGCSYYFDKPVGKPEWHSLVTTVGGNFELKATGS